MAKELANQLAQKLSTPATCKAQCTEKCYLSQGESVTDCLYCVAETRLKELEKVANHFHSRIQLAKELGLFDLRTWFGDADLPLGRNYPKHRAIARLAADHRFHAIISLNWDCFLEAALIAVGLSENATNPDHPGRIKRFTIIVGDDQHHAPCSDTFRLIKPHGCVKNLQDQLMTQPHKEPVFKVTHADLSSIKSDVVDEIKLNWKGRPLIACGWSGSEDYLKNIASNVKPECCLINTEDRLTVIDVRWQEEHHNHLASCYATDKDHAFFDITNSDINNFWMSIYTKYAVQKMRGYATSREIIQQLDTFLASTSEKSEKAWDLAIQFCDSFLSSWCRLCWRLGAVKCFREDQTQIPSSHIPLVPLDWHVPFDTHVGTAPDQRPDLQAAGILLAELMKTRDTNPWRFDDFPGCLWHKDNEVLLFPSQLFFQIIILLTCQQ